MPAVSKKQQRYFGYLLSNPEERKKKGISKKAAKDFAQDVQEVAPNVGSAGTAYDHPKYYVGEVAPPGWGHTKAEKEKTKPNKPKSKIGGSSAAFKRALDDGRFKGLPGDKTKKDKVASMFKIMWANKKKGYKPHYKPGTDEKYEKYQKEETSMPNVDLKDRKVIKARAKNLFKKDLKGEVQGVNESSYRDFIKAAQDARERDRKYREERKKKDIAYVERVKKGIRFYDAKGSGYIKSGKKVYD